eukprot:TRINITY_DN4102_c0_g1_i1.p1 TRINITY_DN4102_c0_g1~~TRINITY_DN4102_c0_g1_i1.p1  ORF type:complete len:214 (+),score=68.50 TRINITY_DN4102_c0_g1_i1:42-683(+)
MATYKLYYFNGEGRAAAIRALFKIGGIDFEDIRFKSADSQEEGGLTLAEFKQLNISPYGQVPVLEIVNTDGESQYFGQSAAIERFLAKKVGVYGDNEIEELIIDGIKEGINDLVTAFFGTKSGSEEEINEKVNLFMSETLPKFFNVVGKIKDENGANGFLVGTRFSYADLSIFTVIKFLESNGILDTYNPLTTVPTLAENNEASLKFLAPFLA